MDKEQEIKEALAKLNKQYGKGTVINLGDKNVENHDVFSSGSMRFDEALGIGGFAKGRLYELMGWEGTGKTTICGHLAAECQKKGGTVAYIDGEHAVDLDYFRALGIDTDKMLFAQPSNGEEGFEIARQLIGTGGVDLVIIDSDSSLIPKAVLEGDVGNSSIGKKALLNSNVYPKLKIELTKNGTCVVVISQYREKIGVMFGNPTTTQGGHALKFYSDVRIEVSKTPAKEGDDHYGNVTKIKVIKNKMSPPFKTAQFEVVFGQGIDKDKEILELSIEKGIINKAGSWYSYGDTRIGQGEQSVVKFLADNPDLFEDIKSKIKGE